MDALQLERLTMGPVLETRAGCRARLALLTMGERLALAAHWGLGDLNLFDDREFVRRLHRPRHKRRRQPPTDNQ
jgi:hypothetical protein